MTISAIAAMDQDRFIGKAGGLPWDIPEDMAFFRTKTKGHIIIVGRKTYESFGKLLPNRKHLIISRQKNLQIEGAECFTDVDSALGRCEELTTGSAKNGPAAWPDEIFVIGGAEIYREFLPATHRIYLTEIRAKFPGDARFPEFSSKEFQEIERRPGQGQVPLDFVTYQRRQLVAR